MNDTAEHERLRDMKDGGADWHLWGPYLSERQWGTVREDYSAGGVGWDYLPHDHARSRAYRWGEDGIAGLSDREQFTCLSLAMWNGADPILKERLFGLTNGEGNHGEDVKERYHYLDATPTHSYLKTSYKYPQRAYPYGDLVQENARRGIEAREYEIEDTGVFADDRFFDIVVEYAKADADDIAMRVTATNRGPDAAPLVLLPQFWYRNVWSWDREAIERPTIRATGSGFAGTHEWAGEHHLACDGKPELLLADNDTNTRRLFGDNAATGPFKDAFHAHVVDGADDVLTPQGEAGTKAGALYRFEAVAPGESVTVRLRLKHGTPLSQAPFRGFDALFEKRIAEADAFYETVHAQGYGVDDAEPRRIQRQALAGMIWTKQTFNLDMRRWLKGDPDQPAPPRKPHEARNAAWAHLNARDVLSMPDKWEYPWFAAWDSAFHCLPLAMVDPDFAKDQLVTLTRETYMHPNGQIPAYEWAFGDVNPPVHAWATWRVFEIDREATGKADMKFLERVFHKLMLNFTWWVNRKDVDGRNVFQGGFLGLDNIGVFDRSNPPPHGGTVNQADGTAWMAMYALNMMRIASELARANDAYEDIAAKYFEHFMLIAEAMTDMGGHGYGLWDERDEFYYDELIMPGPRHVPMRVRSMVGLVPLFAVEVIDHEHLTSLPAFAKRLRWTLKHRPELAALVSRWQERGEDEKHLLSLLRGHRMKALLKRMLDEEEFLSPHGIRSLSKYHETHPFELKELGPGFTVDYQSGESQTHLFGGNSNWRGPIWFPLNYLIVESLRRFHAYYGPDFQVECPAGSGTYMNLDEIADFIAARLNGLFLPDAEGRRVALPGDPSPSRPDELLFHEFFDGDDGRGLGASHQTGWTGLVAILLAGRI